MLIAHFSSDRIKNYPPCRDSTITHPLLLEGISGTPISTWCQTSTVWRLVIFILFWLRRDTPPEGTRILLNTTFSKFCKNLFPSHRSIGFTGFLRNFLPRPLRHVFLFGNLQLIKTVNDIIIKIQLIRAGWMEHVTIKTEELDVCLNNSNKTHRASTEIWEQERISVMDLFYIFGCQFWRLQERRQSISGLNIWLKRLLEVSVIGVVLTIFICQERSLVRTGDCRSCNRDWKHIRERRCW